MDFTVSQTLPALRVADLLLCGFEGGSFGCGYWCRVMDYREPASLDAAPAEVRAYPHASYALTGDGAVVCRLYEEETDEQYTPLVLDRAAIERGLALMPTKAPGHWSAFLSQQEDATTGDVFIQLCLLGDVVYG